jgi:predicted porin
MRNYLLASAAVLGLVAAGTAQAASFAPADPNKDSTAFAAPLKKPDPGKIIVHMGGLVDVGAVAGSSSADKAANGSKNQQYGMYGYFRLYFGMDGKLTNGMIYGAKSELRTTFAPQGGIGNSSANSTKTNLYVRRAYGYIGGDQWGIVRIGQGDGPNSLFNGISTGEAYDTGQWDGDICAFYGATCLSWAFLDVGNEYVSNKIVWVSPSWSGLQIAASYAPASVGVWANGNGFAGPGNNANQSSSVNGSDWSRPKDMFEVAARWQGNLGPVGVDGKIGYLGSSVVKAVGPATAPYKDLSVFDAGLAVSYMGASLFGHISTGKMDGAVVPQIVSPNYKKDGLAWVVGAQYANGPWTVGTSWYEFDHMGGTASLVATSYRKERGFGIGGNYNVVPGFDVFLSYIWGEIKQPGYNFWDGKEKVQTSAVIATALFRW